LPGERPPLANTIDPPYLFLLEQRSTGVLLAEAVVEDPKAG
jgi:hypothetical protein